MGKVCCMAGRKQDKGTGIGQVPESQGSLAKDETGYGYQSNWQKHCCNRSV